MVVFSLCLSSMRICIFSGCVIFRIGVFFVSFGGVIGFWSGMMLRVIFMLVVVKRKYVRSIIWMVI